MSTGNHIQVNVGGQIMSTYRTTLLKSEFFKSYIDRWNSGEQLFLDVDPNLFIHVLNKLRNSSYVLPDDNNVLNMCQYFGLAINDHHNIIDSYIIPYQCYRNGSLTYKINTNDCTLTDLILIDNGHLSFVEISVGPIKMYTINQDDICAYFDLMQTSNRKIDTYILRQKYLEPLQNLGEICLHLRAKDNSDNNPNQSQLKCVVARSHKK